MEQFSGAGGNDDHKMSESIQIDEVEIGRAFGPLPGRELARRKDVDDESRHVGSRMRVDVDDSGGLFLPEIIDKAGGEFVRLLVDLLARSSVRYGHQQAMLRRHLHASDDSFQLLSFQTHSLIDA